MDAVFTNTLGDPVPVDDGSDEAYVAEIKKRIDDAADYEQSYLSLQRQINMEYYYGLRPQLGDREPAEYDGPDLPDPTDVGNRSTAVSTDVRDTILSVIPSLVRIFTNAEHPVEFVPNTEANAEAAKQATIYVKHVFEEENDGFLILYDIFKDTLMLRLGIAEVRTDTSHQVVEQEFVNVTAEQFQALMFEAEESQLGRIEVVDEDFDPVRGIYTHLRLRWVKSTPRYVVESVPPDEFRIDRAAKSVKTARLIGREELLPPSDVVAKGYSPEMVEPHIGSGQAMYSEERYLRNPGLTEETNTTTGVIFGRYYIRIDADGDGIDELHYIETLGDTHEIVHDEIVQDHCFAVFSGDPRPHTVIGDSLADLTTDIQRIKTNMLRSLLDNLAESINPKMVINEMLTNIEDALNDEVGAVIRTRAEPTNAVTFANIPFVGDKLQPALDYFDKIRTSRTGISEASKGLDPKAMQSTALTAIDAIITGAQERIELIALILANTGFKRLFKLLLREIVNNPNPAHQVNVNGQFLNIDPSTWDADMKLRVNPTLGKGTDIARLMALREIKATQEVIMEKFGVANMMVTPVEYRNTLTDILAIANVKNVGRYFKDIDPAALEEIMNAPREPDPAEILAQAELEKVKKDIVVATDKSRQADEKLALQREKLERDDDFRRDKLNIDAAVKVVDALQAVTDQQVQPQTELAKMNKVGD